MNNKKKIYCNNAFWNDYWKKEKREKAYFCFDDIVDRYINWNAVRSYMEVGGAPGSIMEYMKKKHGLEVSTIDFSERVITENYMKKAGLKDYKYYQKDFIEMDIASHIGKYDMVASWGFVEHFGKNICNRIIDKHKKMVTDGGYLVIELPYIRKLFWLMYFIFNRDLIKIHNLEIMDLNYLKNQICKDGEYDLLFAGYYIAINVQNDYFIKHRLQRSVCLSIVNFLKHRYISDRIKKLVFPYIVCIAKKRQS